MQRIAVTDGLNALYNSFFPYLRQKTPTPDRIIELKFREMLLNILTNPENKGLMGLIAEITSFSQSPIPRVMEANFNYKLDLEGYARLCGRSLSSFKRDFKKCYSIAPGRWLLQRQLNFSQELLSTALSVQEVCFDSGFENSSHFVRVFREAFGQTPLEFRKNPALRAG